MSEDTKACPYCAETIKAAAIVCRYCGRDLQKQAQSESLTEAQAEEKKGTNWGCIIVVIIVGIIATLWALSKAGGGSTSVNQPAKTTPVPNYVAIDGYDKDSGTTLQSINVWKDYENRAAGVATTVRHGQSVIVRQRSGDGVLIETNDGVRGWVTYYFIKEYK